jgi:hypothetical protein
LFGLIEMTSKADGFTTVGFVVVCWANAGAMHTVRHKTR